MQRSVVLIFAIAALVASETLARPALAQNAGSSGSSTIGIPFSTKHQPTQEELDKRDAVDSAYDRTLQKLPDKTAPSDPWGAMRPANSTAKTTKTTSKTTARTTDKTSDKVRPPPQPPSQ